MSDLDIYKSELCGLSLDWTQLKPTLFISVEPLPEKKPLFSQNQESASYENPSHDDKQRIVSAYAIYFRECLPTLKLTFPEANFGEYSRLVAAQWDSLSKQKKKSYQQKAQRIKKEQIRSAALQAVRKVYANRSPLKSISNNR